MTAIQESAYTSVQLIGEYGVYSNGRMLQLILPLKTKMTFELDSPPSDFEVEIQADPKNLLPHDYAEKQKERARNRIKEIRRWLIRRYPGKIIQGTLTFHVDFPMSIGIEDNIAFLSHSVLSGITDPYLMTDNIMKCEWEMGRKSCSYIYLLPAITIATNVFSDGNIFALERPMPSFVSWGEFETFLNRPDRNFKAEDWLREVMPISLPGILSDENTLGIKSELHETLFDIAIFIRSKVPLPKTLHPSVRDAVSSLSVSDSMPLLKNLGNLTDMAFVALGDLAQAMKKKKEVDIKAVQESWWKLGRLLTCYHHTLSALQRTDMVSDAFVSELCQIREVVGAKTTASGLGGTVLALYSCPQKDAKPVLATMTSVADKFGYTLLCPHTLSGVLAMQTCCQRRGKNN